MKRRIGLIAMTPALMACERVDRHPPESYQRWVDRMVARVGLPNVGIWPCGEDEPTEDCFKMQPSQEWRGIWALGPGEHMEWFCPNSAELCPWDKRPKFGLEWNRRTFNSRPQMRAEWGKRYVLHFVGRRTAYQSGYPGEGYTIVVDRLIAKSELTGPRDKTPKQ